MLRTLGFLSLLYCMIVVASSQSCVPSCLDDIGNPVPEGTKVPNPVVCAQYYVCSDVNGDGEMELSNNVITCNTGTYFDVVEHVCKLIPAEGAPCQQLCNPCVIECTEPGDILPSMDDCRKFTYCVTLTVTSDAFCAPGQLFDYIKGECVKTEDTSVCYDLCDPCEIYCIKEGIIADPENCNGYVFCEPPGYVNFDCPAGMMFDSKVNHCITEVADGCTNICPAETTTTATTTTTGGSVKT